MDIMIIALLVLLAIFLVIVETLLLPGTTIAAVGAVASAIYASYMTYTDYGFGAAIALFAGTLLLSLIVLLLCIKKKNISKISLHTNSDSVVPNVRDFVKIGDQGIAVTRLAPMGSVRVDGSTVEAKSVGGFIDPKCEIRIVAIEDNVVLVEKYS